MLAIPHTYSPYRFYASSSSPAIAAAGSNTPFTMKIYSTSGTLLETRSCYYSNGRYYTNNWSKEITQPFYLVMVNNSSSSAYNRF